VLITYYNDDTYENTQTIFTTLVSNFKNIIRQANAVFEENRRTEYLIILGSRIKDQGTMSWSKEVLNTAGQSKGNQFLLK